MNPGQPHPVRCWLFDGHERCAVRAAAQHAENRAAWLRSNERTPTAEAVATALAQLNSQPPGPPPKRIRGPQLLTEVEIQEARDLYGINGGEVGLVSMRQLGEFYGVSRQTIFNAVHAGRWEVAENAEEAAA
jgi:hypothetical protein